MGRQLRKLRMRLPIFINAAFTLVFFVHAAFIAYGIKYPDQPSTKIYAKNLDEFDFFQLSFKLCVKEMGDINKRYKSLGYDSIWSFYKGSSYDYDDIANGIWVGWAGHSKNNSTLSTVKGMCCIIN